MRKVERTMNHMAANIRAAEERNALLIEALSDATAHLIGATSAYETYVGNSMRKGKRDALYKTRLKDFNKACERARAVLLKVKGEQG